MWRFFLLSLSLAHANLFGDYCGGIPFVIKLNTDFFRNNTVNVQGDLLGHSTFCAEPFQLNSINSIILPSLTQKNDCLGKYFRNHHVDPESLILLYNTSSDIINVSIMGHNLKLRKCSNGANELN